ncbi:SDR family oxidoreductase [Pontibacter akesuensis]|uniref:NAD(P)-dependent dehydrogenase, short-chain alcohol dehydrogenase family n=1 Tax=Pontibacter akesuensis TaxID=388950 RepID=A0A1I7I358_9BACT|nr:SDR family oxidoreductase [Pontibacter akesuensis]SFU67392.1 NAD(P)-dependent dehydrogenase, short-chain alcohol dehydrogenase family [Pontibacter akesuensis]
MENKPHEFPPQQMEQPGKEHKMNPEPEIIRDSYKGSDKLKDKVALITGGDSGIGRAVAVHYAREGADVAIVYLNEDKDAQDTKEMVEKEGRKCILIAGDVGEETFAKSAVKRTVEELGRLDILVNNAGEQHEQKDIRDITDEQLKRTFATNIFGMFYFVKAALDHLKEGSTIINTTSVTAYHGNKLLLDYSSTKGAILAFTRTLAQMVADKKIRVNGVAPGPIWTPLIPASFDEEHVKTFGQKTLLKRAGQPSEVAPAYVYLASEDSAFTIGEIMHINGGEMVTT